jgi:transposase InsO family protein
MWFSFRLLLAVTRLLPRERRDLVLDNLALRHQLAIYQRARRRPPLEERDRRFWSTLARGWSSWRGTVSVVQPDTVVRWHRMAWRRYWTWKSRRRRSGRPRIPSEVQALIRRMARENPRWGAVRIVGELRALGIDVSASTVRTYRRQALRRPPSPSWRTFLRLHAPHIWAADFFTVQTLTFRTLYVFVLLSHDRRRIVHWNVTAHPTAPWVWRQILQATPWGTSPRFLIRDRDRSYGADFVARAAGIGIEAVLTPIHAPQANALAERVIGTIRRECLDHLIAVNERHLRRVLREYVAYYNAERPHRSLALSPPAGPRPLPPSSARDRIDAEPVLGGLHHVYRWAA